MIELRITFANMDELREFVGVAAFPAAATQVAFTITPTADAQPDIPAPAPEAPRRGRPRKTAPAAATEPAAPAVVEPTEPAAPAAQADVPAAPAAAAPIDEATAKKALETLFEKQGFARANIALQSAGAGRFRDLTPDQYPAFVAKINEMLAEGA